MNTAEQMRKQTLDNQVRIVNATIALAVENGKFECQGSGHLTDSTLSAVRAEGFGIKNRSYGFNNYWHASW